MRVGDLVEILSHPEAAPIGIVVKVHFWGVDVLFNGEVELFDPEQLGVLSANR